METRVIMPKSHNENIMDKVHKHMSANVECTNVEIKMQNIFFSATQQQVTRGSRGTIDAFFGKTIVSRFYSHLTSSSWEGFGYALKHNLGGIIMWLLSTTHLWRADNLLVTLLNTTNKQYLPKRVVIIPLQQNISFFLGKLGMIDVKKMC